MLSWYEYQNAVFTLTFLTQTDRDYAIFGTGKVAGQLLDMIAQFRFKAPAFAFNSGAAAGATFRGLPVIAPKKGEKTPVVPREIILATNAFQAQMKAELKKIGGFPEPLDLTAMTSTKTRMPPIYPPANSETGKVRKDLMKYCAGDGLDIGFGGDPILPSAIALDQPTPYTRAGSGPQHLHGDATNLAWFKDKTLDYVYSSHVLEDFLNTAGALDEWIRVLRVGGKLVLFLPDQQAYVTHFTKLGQGTNKHHVHADFSLAKVKALLLARGDMKIIHEKTPSHIYSFEIVAERVR